MPRPLYFERQVGHNCTIHAANNALQQHVLTAAIMGRVARRLAREQAQRTRRHQQDTGRAVETLRVLTERAMPYLQGSMLGDWSPDVAYAALRERGIYAVHGRTQDFPQRGAWILTGETAVQGAADGAAGGTYAHSVAVLNGWWLDSERPRPVRLRPGNPLPVYFRVWACTRLTTTPPPPPPAQAEPIDLTQADA